MNGEADTLQESLAEADKLLTRARSALARLRGYVSYVADTSTPNYDEDMLEARLTIEAIDEFQLRK